MLVDFDYPSFFSYQNVEKNVEIQLIYIPME